MSEGAGAPDLRGLEDRYEVLGELRGTDAGRTYIARTRDGSAEVAITVVLSPKGAQNNELSHYAADVQILESLSHPTLARIVSGQWVGNDSFAVITERLNGDTLGELLDRGERFSNPRIALLLQEVSGVLDWARDRGIVHRTVTPDTIVFERETNRLRLTFAPAALPMTGVPDASGDARTLGMLAWAMFTGDRYDASAVGRSLGDVSPNLAARVIDATDRAIRCKDGSDAPDVATFLGIIASGDVLKQAEVELAAQKEEYDEEHRREIRRYEAQRLAIEQHAAEQAAALAGEREEFARAIAEERAAVAAERAELELVMSERKDRLASVRAELDKQRAEMERRLADLEAYRLEVEKARDNALAAAERARQDAIADAERWRAQILASAGMGNASMRELISGMALPKGAAVPRVPIPTAPKALKEMKAPKWDRTMERLDVSDEELIAATERPRWMIPAGVATVVIILVSGIYGMTHRPPVVPDTVRVGNTTVVATPDSAPGARIPRGGFLAQPVVSAAAAESLAAQPATSPIIAAPKPRTAVASPARLDSAAGAVQSQAMADSARRRAAPPARHVPTQEEIDSVNTAPAEWARMRRADSIARARRDSAAGRRPVPPDTGRRRFP